MSTSYEDSTIESIENEDLEAEFLESESLSLEPGEWDSLFAGDPHVVAHILRSEAGAVDGDTPGLPSGWADLPLSPEHAQMLHDSAITVDVARASGVFTAYNDAQIPESVNWLFRFPEAFPALVFPLNELDGRKTCQVRPATPISTRAGVKPAKYVSGGGKDAPSFSVIREAEGDTSCLVVEGRKQSLAAASYAPPGMSIYSIPGINSWLRGNIPCEGLRQGHMAGKKVVVLCDADAETNRYVYDGALRLGEALLADGASSVRFGSLSGLGAKGVSGLDDVLASYPPEHRSRILGQILTNADGNKAPAKSAPAYPLTLPDDGRVPIPFSSVAKETLELVRDTLVSRSSDLHLFEQDGSLVTLDLSRGQGSDGAPHYRVRPITLPRLKRMVQDSCALYAVDKRTGETTQPLLPHAMAEVLQTYHDSFPPLRGVLLSPAFRDDGSLALGPGYDVQTGYFFNTSNLEGLNVSENPSDAELRGHRDFLLTNLFGDFPFRGEGDRAGALALLFTFFVAPHLARTPGFNLVADHYGSGKGKILEVCSLIATGFSTPTGVKVSSEEELRKRLTASLTEGRSLIALDESSFLNSESLNTFLTAEYWSDRTLGKSETVTIRNRSMLVSMGNQVDISNDASRRWFTIRMESRGSDPSLRPLNTFRHPYLEEWVKEHRSECLSSVLTILKAWFDRGRPAPQKSVPFHSFLPWARCIGGVMEMIGVDTFLSNFLEDRDAGDVDGHDWELFFNLLLTKFGANGFTTKELAMVLVDPLAPFPPGMKRDERVDPAALGRVLRKQTGHARLGVYLSGTDQKRGNARVWNLVPTSVGALPVPIQALPSPAPAISPPPSSIVPVSPSPSSSPVSGVPVGLLTPSEPAPVGYSIEEG